MLGAPELDTVLQVRSHESGVKGQNHLPDLLCCFILISDKQEFQLSAVILPGFVWIWQMSVGSRPARQVVLAGSWREEELHCLKLFPLGFSAINTSCSSGGCPVGCVVSQRWPLL